jgi:hypothetical protein
LGSPKRQRNGSMAAASVTIVPPKKFRQRDSLSSLREPVQCQARSFGEWSAWKGGRPRLQAMTSTIPPKTRATRLVANIWF